MSGSSPDRILRGSEGNKTLMHWDYLGYAGLAVVAGITAWALVISRRIRRDSHPVPLTPAGAILVFGAGVWQSGPSLSLRVRVDRAAEVYREGWAPEILCSGGWSGAKSEAAVMRGLLIEAGVPASAIISDDGGVSTQDAISWAKSFATVRGWRRIIAVSSPYHMHRIGIEARCEGLNVILCPAQRTGSSTLRLRLFDLRQHFREVRAVLACSSEMFLQPLPRLWRGVVRRVNDHVVGRLKWMFRDAD